MQKTSKTYKNVDQYIAAFQGPVRASLETMRGVIAAAAPDAEECIAYGVPTWKLHGKSLVHMGGFTEHVGLFRTLLTLTSLKKELEPYKTSAGTVRFPVDEPLPVALIGHIVQARVAQVNAGARKRA